MKLGLMADVRGMPGPLHAALELLEAAGCGRVVCLGSTAEGGPDDEAVLSALSDAGAVVVPSPHDAHERLASLPPEVTESGLVLAHATPSGMYAAETFWLTGFAVPWVTTVADQFRSHGEQRACGDLYAPLAYLVPDEGPPQRRVFLGSATLTAPRGSFLACPGSVAVTAGRHGAAVMTWDEATRELAVIRFRADGSRVERPERPCILAYCTDFAPHLPDGDVLEHVNLVVKADADGIATDVADLQPEFVLLDYHLAGRASGLDALIGLRAGRDALPAPVFTIAGDPAENEGMKSAGALGGLPFTFLKDTLSRLIREITVA